MPPLEDDASQKSFTWITGNPRSKKNITQIRRHAGQNSGVKAENGARAHSGSSPRPGQRSSITKNFRPVYPSPKIDETDEHRSIVQQEQPLDFNGNYSSGTSEYAETHGHVPWTQTNQPLNFHVNYPSAAVEYTSTNATTGSANALQPVYPVTPTLEGPPMNSGDATPPRKLAIWDLVNHSAEEEERHRLSIPTSTPRQDTEDDRPDYFSSVRLGAGDKDRLEVLASSPRQDTEMPDYFSNSVHHPGEERNRLGALVSTLRQDTDDDRPDYFDSNTARAEIKKALSEARSHSPRNPHTSPPRPATIVLQANISKRRKPTVAPPTSHSHVSWRLDPAPTPHVLHNELRILMVSPSA